MQILWTTLAIPFLCLAVALSLPSERAGHRGHGGYRRFHTNDSFVGQPVPCTNDEKICFRYNLMFNPKKESCSAVGREGTACDIRANNQEFEHGSGHIFASCETYEDPCPGHRMAYNGRCYPSAMVRDVICRCRNQPVRHFLRGVECSCRPPAAVHVEQPTEDGRCLIPDFRFPDAARSLFLQDPLGAAAILGNDMTCSDEQSKCFSEGKVSVAGASGCFRLLTRGPCGEDQIVAMDREAAGQRRAAAKCVGGRGGCPQGQIRMAFDGECHDRREMQVAAPGTLYRNIFGHFIVRDNYSQVVFYGRTHREKPNVCIVDTSVQYGFVTFERSPEPICGPNDKSQCSLYEIEVEPPSVEEDK